MTVSNAAYLKGFFDTARAQGAKAISSDFTFEIEGFEATYLLVKQAPWPTLSPGGEIEVPLPLGSKMWQAQQIENAKQGPISIFETEAGLIDQTLIDLITRGGYFNAKIYEGTPLKYLRYKKVKHCFMQIDNADRDWENRSQVLNFSGTLFYHYYGEMVEGNSKDYR